MRWNSEVSWRGSMFIRSWRRVGSRFLDGWLQAEERGTGKFLIPLRSSRLTSQSGDSELEIPRLARCPG